MHVFCGGIHTKIRVFLELEEGLLIAPWPLPLAFGPRISGCVNLALSLVCWRGICFRMFSFFVFCLFFRFWASWLFGFMAFRLLGFLAFWLLGFLAFRLLVGLCGFWWLFGFSHPLHSQFLFGRWRFGFCGFSVVYAAFGGFGFSHPLLSQFLSFWLPASSASPVFSLFESSLLRTSRPPRYFSVRIITWRTLWGGCRPPPTPPLLFDFLLQGLKCPPI